MKQKYTYKIEPYSRRNNDEDLTKLLNKHAKNNWEPVMMVLNNKLMFRKEMETRGRKPINEKDEVIVPGA